MNRRKLSATTADVAAALQSAWATIEDPSNWQPFGRNGARKSALRAIIDASLDAGVDYRVPLIHLGLRIGATDTGQFLAWAKHSTHDETRAAFARALDALTSVERVAA